MNEKLECPKCKSINLHITSEQNQFDTSIMQDENMIMAMEINRPDIFSANCNDCGSKLKLTNEGLRLAN